MIQLERVSHAWSDGAPALADLSLRISEGERVVVLGANGCGKSTLLKILNGLVFPDRGAYRYHGEPVTRERFRDRAWSRDFRRNVALLFQSPDAMLFNPTVRDEIAYGPRQLGLADAGERAEQWARALGLVELLDLPSYRLSGGEKQKVCLAALLALEPAVLLLDEPIAHLDPRATGWLIDFLADLKATTVVNATRIPRSPPPDRAGVAARSLAEDHRLLFDGPVEEALRDQALLVRANLTHRHRHRHGALSHSHEHAHDWN
ncbi:MAG: ABC transporter ATP-binding protein [Candidatus Competibacteraceae bacterium]|nr:ABC transporter ATP-binding protein [Candidatus Competibacteraceae bacterium]